jgi:tRNA A-37 threonylcarbamoyl transferase component Bud32
MELDLVGQTLSGCKILRELQRGGMSQIYLADQTSIGREVVVKVILPDLLGDPTFLQRFEQEVSMTARLQHPHIIPIYDYGEEQGVPFIVMAYMPGGSLEDQLSGGPLDLSLAAGIMKQIATGLDYAHQRGVVHRDIKPANILLDAQRNAVLTDFGIARLMTSSDRLTLNGLVGTPTYLAPEVVTDEFLAGPPSDVYGLGVTLYEMLTGERLFAGKSAMQTMWAHVNEPVPLVHESRTDLPNAVDMVLQKALAKNPAARYASAGELAEDLVEVAAGAAPSRAQSAPPPKLVEAPTAQVRRLEDAVRRVIDQVVKVRLVSEGAGTGVYLPDNHVVTCRHVIDGAPGIIIQFRTGEQISAEVLAVDAGCDLALLRLDHRPETLEPASLDGLVYGAREMELGEPLAAIGHPLGLNWAVTGGHYNATRLPGEEALKMFGIKLKVPLVQVDVAINPGNSGGPLIDPEGRLIGIADSIINPALANNIGFAVEGQVVYDFWQANSKVETPLIAYTCGHHHPAGETFCPLTGQPVQALEPVPMPTADSIRYSCGHYHPPGLDYCPLTGRPIGVRGQGAETPETGAAADVPTGPVTCTNCGHEFPARDRYCPRCGKPAR